MAKRKTTSTIASAQSPELVTFTAKNLDFLEPVSILAARVIGHASNNFPYRRGTYRNLPPHVLGDLASITTEDLQVVVRNFHALDKRAAMQHLEDAENGEEFDVIHETRVFTKKEMEHIFRIGEGRFNTYAALALYVRMANIVAELSELGGNLEQAKAMDEYLDLLSSMDIPPQAEVNSIISAAKRNDLEWDIPFTQAVKDAEEFFHSEGDRDAFPYALGKAIYLDDNWDRIMRIYTGDAVYMPGMENFIQLMLGFGMTVGVMVASKHGIRINTSLPIPEAKEASGVKA